MQLTQEHSGSSTAPVMSTAKLAYRGLYSQSVHQFVSTNFVSVLAPGLDLYWSLTAMNLASICFQKQSVCVDRL